MQFRVVLTFGSGKQGRRMGLGVEVSYWQCSSSMIGWVDCGSSLCYNCTQHNTITRHMHEDIIGHTPKMIII